MLYAKPCCAVDPIENEEDRKKVEKKKEASSRTRKTFKGIG